MSKKHKPKGKDRSHDEGLIVAPPIPWPPDDAEPAAEEGATDPGSSPAATTPQSPAVRTLASEVEVPPTPAAPHVVVADAPGDPDMTAANTARSASAVTVQEDISGPDPLDLETMDMADIAPVGPTELLEDFVAPSVRSARAGAAADSGPAGEPQGRTVEELTQQIRDLESRLDQMLHERRSRVPPPSRSSTSRGERGPDLDWSDGAAPAAPAPSAHDLLSSEFYRRQWGQGGMRRRAEEVDELGLDPEYEERVRPFLDFLYRYYFRVIADGVHHLPASGRCLVVANHAGGPLPYDGLMLRAAVRKEHPARRELRWLAEDFVFYLPFVGVSLNRLGAVRACQENAERLLARERLVAVFPEGAKGIGKLFGERYRLQRFGRGGFIRLCLRTGTPIVPCAIVGAEEANPTLYRVESLAKLIGLPYLPVTPTFPLLGPAGLLPAPTKWRIRFGAPITFDQHGPPSADDDLLVTRLTEGVRSVIQDMLTQMLAGRRSIWWG